MASSSLVCLLVLLFVLVASPGAFAQEGLLPSWMSGSNSDGNPATETTSKRPGCTASLDVQTNGNPNCPQDQQFFDIDSCGFVCLPTQTPPQPAPTSQKNVLP